MGDMAVGSQPGCRLANRKVSCVGAKQIRTQRFCRLSSKLAEWPLAARMWSPAACVTEARGFAEQNQADIGHLEIITQNCLSMLQSTCSRHFALSSRLKYQPPAFFSKQAVFFNGPRPSIDAIGWRTSILRSRSSLTWRSIASDTAAGRLMRDDQFWQAAHHARAKKAGCWRRYFRHAGRCPAPQWLAWLCRSIRVICPS